MFDLAIVFIIMVFGIIGYYTGFIRTVLTLLSSVIAFVFAVFIYPIINTFLKMTPIDTYINNWIANKLEGIEFGTMIQTQGKVIAENITWLPKVMSEAIIKNNNQEVYRLLEVSQIEDYVSVYITHIILSMISVLITWVALKILFTLFLNTTHAIVSHLPVVSTADKAGGLGIGMAKGILSIWLFYLLVPFLITYPYFSKIEGYIEQSYLAKWLYENNMILYSFDKFFRV